MWMLSLKTPGEDSAENQGKPDVFTPALLLLQSGSRYGLAPCLSFPFCERGVFLLPSSTHPQPEQWQSTSLRHHYPEG